MKRSPIVYRPFSLSLGWRLDRGVFIAPWDGPNGEIVLIAISTDHHLVGSPVVVPFEVDGEDLCRQLWAVLDDSDPPCRSKKTLDKWLRAQIAGTLGRGHPGGMRRVREVARKRKRGGET